MRYGPIRCRKIHPERPISSLGMCASCYGQWREKRTPEQKEEIRRQREVKRNRPCKHCGGPRGYGACKDICHSCYQTKQQVENYDKYRRICHKSRLKKYGLSPEEYQKMLESQGGACALCEKPAADVKLCVDHDHETGRVRALLCYRCNLFLGWLEKNLALAALMQQYLLIHKDNLSSAPKIEISSSEMVN